MTKALQYTKHRHHLVRLGRTCEFEKRFEFYDLWRASWKRLNGVDFRRATQTMGNRGDVCEWYYMPAFIDRDCQAIYLGSTQRDDLIQVVGWLACHERAPKRLIDMHKFEISRHPDLLDLMKGRARYFREIKDHGFRTIKAAKGMKLSRKHKDKQAEINTLKSQLSEA